MRSIIQSHLGVVHYSELETTSAPPRSRENPMLIVNWHIKSDMQIYQGQDLHSSPIEAVEGNVIKTTSGHYYILVGRDPAIRTVQQLLAPPGSPHDTYCTANPLNPSSLSQLLLAEKIIYGNAKVPCAQLIAALRDIEGALGPHEQLDAVKEILQSFGITPTTVATEDVVLVSPVVLPATQIGVGYGLLLGAQDTSLGHHIAVLSRVPLRELVLRIMYEHRHRHFFSLCLMKVEPLTDEMTVEWRGRNGAMGSWTPDETCQSVITGNTSIGNLGFEPETEFIIKLNV
jgi:hypothetical protein